MAAAGLGVRERARPLGDAHRGRGGALPSCSSAWGCGQSSTASSSGGSRASSPSSRLESAHVAFVWSRLRPQRSASVSRVTRAAIGLAVVSGAMGIAPLAGLGTATRRSTSRSSASSSSASCCARRWRRSCAGCRPAPSVPSIAVPTERERLAERAHGRRGAPRASRRGTAGATPSASACAAWRGRPPRSSARRLWGTHLCAWALWAPAGAIEHCPDDPPPPAHRRDRVAFAITAPAYAAHSSRADARAGAKPNVRRRPRRDRALRLGRSAPPTAARSRTTAASLRTGRGCAAGERAHLPPHAGDRSGQQHRLRRPARPAGRPTAASSSSPIAAVRSTGPNFHSAALFRYISADGGQNFDAGAIIGDHRHGRSRRSGPATP